MRQHGFLIIADITNYTAFLTQTNLDEAEPILRRLVETILDQVDAPLIVSKLEGDAVFMHAPAGSFIQSQTLMEAIEKIYVAFRRTRDSLIYNQCDDAICTRLETLDLKFVVHYGEYIKQDIGGRPELSGSDVVLTHRLLKNHITDETGIGAYTYVTDAAAHALNMGELATQMQWHVETYEYLGDVAGYVHDLVVAWERSQSSDAVAVENVWFTVEAEVPVPPALAWDYLHEPQRKSRWSQSDRVVAMLGNDGRVGVGTVHQCYHGDTTFQHEVVDWRPFDQAAFDVAGPIGAQLRYITRVEPTEDGSRISWVWSRPNGANVLHDSLVKLVSPAMRFFFEGPAYEVADIIQQMIAEDLDAGTIELNTEPPTLDVSFSSA